MGFKPSTNKTQLADLKNRFSEEFLGDIDAIWTDSGINGGAFLRQNSVAGHPGVAYYRSPAGANGGACIRTDATMMVGGGEKAVIVFKTGPQLTDKKRRLFFQDSIGDTAPTNGIYMDCDGTTLRAVAVDNSTKTEGTGYTIVAETWYIATIATASDLSSVTYKLYDETGSTILLEEEITTNIPSSVLMYCADLAWYNGSGIKDLGSIDYIALDISVDRGGLI